MTYEEMERAFEFMAQHEIRLEQFQVESEQRRAQFEVSFQKKMDSLLDQQAKNASDIMQLRSLGMKLARTVAQSHRELKQAHLQLKEQVAESQRQVTESIKGVTELQRGNEIKLNALLTAMARQYGNGRGRKTS